MDTSLFALKKLQKELKDINEKGDVSFTVDLPDPSNFYSWTALIEGPENSIYEGALFSAKLDFPKDYPLNPPRFQFTCPMWHPNIYPSGEVCISILHRPEHDPLNEKETLDEKWRPVLGVKEVILSIQSLLTSPNTDSPANVDAAIQFRNNYDEYRKKVKSMLPSD